jgi:amino acid transporter
MNNTKLTEKMDLIKAELDKLWINWEFSAVISIISVIFIVVMFWKEAYPPVVLIVFFMMGYFGVKSYSLYNKQED